MTRLPLYLPVILVKANQRRAVGRADGNEDRIPVHQGRAVVAAPRGRAFVGFAAEEFDAEILLETDAPKHAAIGQIEAAKLAPAGLHKNQIAVDDRRAARARAPLVAVNGADARAPNFRARPGVHQMSDLLPAVFVEDDKFAACDDRRGETAANAFAPDDLQFRGQFFHGWRISGGVAVVLERVAYRPLRKRGSSKLAALISAIGASLFLQELFGQDKLFAIGHWRFVMLGRDDHYIHNLILLPKTGAGASKKSPTRRPVSTAMLAANHECMGHLVYFFTPRL